MRIVYCIDYYYPHVGGGEVLFTLLAEGLAARGHEVTVLTQAVEDAPLEETHNGVRIRRIETGNSRIAFMFKAKKALLTLAAGADIIHASTYGAAIPAWKVARKLKKPFVLTVHEVWIGKWHIVSDASWLKNTLYDLYERILFHRDYGHYIAVSHSTEGDLVRIGKRPEDVTVIYNGVDGAFWDARRHTVAELPVGWSGVVGRHVFFFSGRPGCSKGFTYLLQALAEVSKTHPGVRLLAIVSNAKILKKAYAETEALIKKLGIGEIVEMRPSVPYGQLPGLALACDTVVVPSLAEGFGFAAAEACALGRPIIASRTSALPEVVSGKVLFAEPRNVADLAVAMERAIRGEYEEIPRKVFPIEDNIKNHLNLYERLIEEGKHP